MKAIYSLAVMALLVISVMPVVLANDLGAGLDVDVTIEDFPPLIFSCGYRTVLDDNTEPGRISDGGQFLRERLGHYAFTGERIKWEAMVLDKNKIESVDVFLGGEVVTDPRTECKRMSSPEYVPEECNARIAEEVLTGRDWNSDTMEYYECEYTVKSDDTGESFITIEVEDESGETGEISEGETWFFNPAIYLSVDGSASFDQVTPGTTVYSEPFQVRNGATDGSQVMLDMFVFGSDFTGSGNCPDSNRLDLENFRYYATHGAYSSQTDGRRDAEGYLPINYGNNFGPDFYNNNEVLQTGPKNGPYYLANVLAPNDWFSVVLKLNVPEPCTGEFNQGQIQFWAEAI